MDDGTLWSAIFHDGREKNMIIDNSIRAKFYGGISDDRQYIVLHYTANSGQDATAKGNANYFHNTTRESSAHYVVDEGNVAYCCVPENRVAWAVGGNKYDNYGVKYYGKCTNYNSISIEMVSHTDSQGRYYIPKATIEHALELVKDIQKRYMIPDENVIRHFDVNGKPCPWCWTDIGDYSGEEIWNIIKAKISGDPIEEKPQDKPEESDILYRVQVGAFKNKIYADDMLKKVKAKGFDAFITQVDGLYKIQVGAFKIKANAEKYLKELENKGIDGFIVISEPKKKPVTKELVAKVIQGDYGNGAERKARLEAEGYDYEEVRKAVNEWLGR